MILIITFYFDNYIRKMYKKREKIIIQRNKEIPKIIYNKATKHVLELSESVELGLEPEPSIFDFIIK